MVGIVVVAHSSELAESIIVLAKQMLHEKVPITAAGGIEDPDHPFGTDPLRIAHAIQSVYNEDGVLVLMDMGSALLSAEMALEFLPKEKRSRVRLCEAPLVEGTVAAAVQAESGGTLDQVMREALSSLAAKEEQLQKIPKEDALDTQAEIVTDSFPEEALIKVHVIIQNALGIHARPAARLVAEASKFTSEISIENITRKRRAVSAKSLNSIATLCALRGDEILFTAQGEDAPEAVESLKRLVESGFGEPIEIKDFGKISDLGGISDSERSSESTRSRKYEPRAIDPTKKTRAEGVITGEPVSPGIAIGPAVLYQPKVKDIPAYHSSNPEDEWNRLERAIECVRSELKARRMSFKRKAGEYEASILDAHLLSLEDPVLLHSSQECIFHQSLNAEAAWNRATEEMLNRYRTVEDEYLRSRGQDLEDIKNQVLRSLLGSAAELIPISLPSVLIAEDLNLTDALAMDPDLVLGICTAFGSPASHTAVIVRSLGIPAIFGAGADIFEIPEHGTVVLDADKGTLLINPADVGTLKRRIRAIRKKSQERNRAMKPAVTLDGTTIEVAANIYSAQEARVALSLGADGVGVFRTEFLYLRRVNPPTEEEQIGVYSGVARLMAHRPLTIRTFDAGGDKVIPYLNLQKELNPFLGRRGIRLCASHKELLTTQVRAILKSAPGYGVRLMFPMVSTLEEIRWAKEIVRDERLKLAAEGNFLNPDTEVGMMIEVPSAVFLAEQFSKEVDFFSIGTNDLTQYIMAADRTNQLVADLNDTFHPAVLRAVKQVIDAGHSAGIKVGVCGEIAGDTHATPLLVGFEIDELSMSPQCIPEVKRMISMLSRKICMKLAQEALSLKSGQEVRELIETYFPVNR